MLDALHALATLDERLDDVEQHRQHLLAIEGGDAVALRERPLLLELTTAAARTRSGSSCAQASA